MLASRTERNMHGTDQPATLFWIDETFAKKIATFRSEANAQSAATRLSAFEQCERFLQTDAEYIPIEIERRPKRSAERNAYIQLLKNSFCSCGSMSFGMSSNLVNEFTSRAMHLWRSGLFGCRRISRIEAWTRPAARRASDARFSNGSFRRARACLEEDDKTT